MKKFKNRKILLSFIILFLFGLAIGLLFILYLKDIDKTLIEREINEYIELIKGDLSYTKGIINSFKINIIYITSIWIVGLIPILFLLSYFIVFYKGFLIGFTISSFILIYKTKGLLLSLIFMFPHEYINIFLFITLGVISIKFSKKMYLKLKRNDLYNFKKDYKNYLYTYFIFIILSLVNSAVEAFINSLLVRLVI